ncbi:hypothetical protein [Flavobacterium tegetincola]|uniref:hypothetical protein n=1 Tax=Flavobacterium tegetincola TaxID=150172 RepID=UPI00040CA48D|nr:hypothetical protein [Flavobacterium tegetincola]
MKKAILILTMLVSLFACNETKKQEAVADKQDSTAVKMAPLEITEIEPDTSETVLESDSYESGITNTNEEPEEDITAKDSINFDKYSVDVQEVNKKAPLDFSSYPDAKFFKTRITEAYNEDTSVVFGGHYVGTIFGCGASCIMGFIMDVRDGKIYDLPLGEQNMCFWDIDKAISNPDSRLFISAICKENEDSKVANYIAYVWNEEQKVFESIAEKEFLIKK